MFRRSYGTPADRPLPSRKDDHQHVKSLNKIVIGKAMPFKSTNNADSYKQMSPGKVVSSPLVQSTMKTGPSSSTPPLRARRSKKAAFAIMSFVFLVLAACHSTLMWHQSCSVSLDLHRTSKGLLTVVSSDPNFVGTPLSGRSYSQVRDSYSTATEVKEPMTIVRLPDDFQGDYQPTSVEDFRALSHTLLDSIMAGVGDERHSDFAIVCICIDMDICKLSEPNHRAFASKHGYDYLYVSKGVNGVPPKMLKYLMLAWAMDRGYEWMLMMDADAIATNFTKTIPSLISDVEPADGISLIATRGGNWKKVHALNNGIFLLKNTEWSKKHCFEIFTSKYSYTRFLGRTLVDQPVQLSLLVAQGEISWPPTSEVETGKHVMIVPKRYLNSFRRDSYYDMTDQEEGGQWQHGDFLAHFASGNKYSLMVELMQQENLPGVPPVERRYPFPIPAPGVDESIKAGTCWCDNRQINCIPRFHVIGVHKAGSKSLVRYLAGHPQLAFAPHVEDPTFWLTDAISNKALKKCKTSRLEDMKRSNYNEQHNPIYIIQRNTSHAISTCSFQDYSLLHGKYSANNGSCPDGLPIEDLQKPMFDEMVIWGHGLGQVRGTPLPELFRLLQPSAHMLISVRNAVDVLYSAYNHFGVFGEGVIKGPGHFHDFVVNLIHVWGSEQCTAANYRRCLAAHPELIAGGSWLSRAMYSKHISAWIEHFGCSQMHLFDTSADPKTEVERLYAFVGVPNEEAAINVTKAVYKLKESDDPNKTKKRSSNALNKASYRPMLNETRAILDDFYAPYNKEMCGLMDTYPCLQLPLFRQYCSSRD